MKKRTLVVFTLIFMLVTSICSAETPSLYPKHTMEQSKKVEATKTLAYVYNKIDEGKMLELVYYAIAAEDTELWLYPMRGTEPKILVEPTDECMKKLFGSYITKNDEAFKATNELQTACDMLNLSGKAQKVLVYENYDDDDVNFLKSFVANNPGIDFSMHTHYVVDGADEVSVYDRFSLESLGYDSCSGAIYNFIDGKLIIEKGKADDNLLVVATADKSELLYISGYMASSETVEKYAYDKTIKGVSLGYNNVNISKGSNPKNVAVSLFTINDEVGDTATDSFELIVKNASSVRVYYKTTPGAGTASAKASYDKTQDDKIKNLDGSDVKSVRTKPVQGEKNQEENAKTPTRGFPSYFETAEAEKPGVIAIIIGIIKRIISIVFTIIKLLIFAFILLLIFYKRFRGNFLAWLFGTKYGPNFQRWAKAIAKLINEFFINSRRKIKGYSSLKGKFVFISHASVDYQITGGVVQSLILELEALGVNCWLGEDGIDISENYNDVLPKAIKKCAFMILFLSPNSINSSEVESEVVAAKRENKAIYPLQIAEFDLFANDRWQHILSQYQVKKLTERDKTAIKQLAANIKKKYDEM